jgi:hypothetical protein
MEQGRTVTRATPDELATLSAFALARAVEIMRDYTRDMTHEQRAAWVRTIVGTERLRVVLTLIEAY